MKEKQETNDGTGGNPGPTGPAGNQGATRGGGPTRGMRLVSVRLPNGMTNNFYGKNFALEEDLFKQSCHIAVFLREANPRLIF